MKFGILRTLWTTALLLIFTLADGARGLRGVRVSVPAAVQAGQTARLLCLYDLENAQLYSLKWYRGLREFYRYVPKEIPPTKVFPFPGINVDLNESGANQVALLDVQAALSGNFSCEVSADAPSFSTAFVSQYMTVVDLPEKRPIISVEKTSFQAGQMLTANCTSLRSRPAANLTFYINDVPVSEEYLERSPGRTSIPGSDEATVSASTWYSSWLGVRAPVPHQAGSLRLKCVANVLMFHQHAELVLEEERPLVLGAREQPGASSSNKPAFSFLLLLLLLPVTNLVLHR